MKKYKAPYFINLDVKLERSLLVISGTSGEDIEWDDETSGDGDIIGEPIEWLD